MRNSLLGLCLLIAAAIPLAPAYAQPPLKLTATYDGVLLIKVLDISIDQSVGETDFTASVRMKSYGALSLFKRLDVRAQTNGRLAGGQALPSQFSHANLDGAVNRSVQVRWSGGDVTAAAQPAYRTAGDPAPTRQQKVAAADPLTEVVRITLTQDGERACRRQSRLFDGRQLYAVTFSEPKSRAVTDRERALGLTSVIRCKAAFAEIAGFDAKPAHRRNQGLKEPLLVELARFGETGPWVLLSVRGSTPLGQARIELKSLKAVASNAVLSMR